MPTVGFVEFHQLSDAFARNPPALHTKRERKKGEGKKEEGNRQADKERGVGKESEEEQKTGIEGGESRTFNTLLQENFHQPLKWEEIIRIYGNEPTVFSEHVTCVLCKSIPALYQSLHLCFILWLYNSLFTRASLLGGKQLIQFLASLHYSVHLHLTQKTTDPEHIICRPLLCLGP